MFRQAAAYTQGTNLEMQVIPMTKFIVPSSKQIRAFKLGAAALLLGGAAYLFLQRDDLREAMAPASTSAVRTVQLVTGEFKSIGPNGRTIEAYRWDPGTIYVKKGDNVRLSIFGVNGASHPFVIEGLNVKGEVKKGEETVVSFRADEAGIYRIVCLTHPDIAHNGPMIGYLVVDK